MTAQKKTTTPLWQSIATTLRAAIAEGQYPEGTRLPTEADLAARFGVNRHTVRHALSALVKDGLVHSRRGAGSFVLARPLEYPLSDRVRFHRNLEDAGRLPGRRLLSLEVRPGTEREARLLELEPGQDVCVTTGLSFADGTPIALAENLYPEARYLGLAEALKEGGGVTRSFEAVGITDYVRRQTRLSATVATATQAAHLRVSEGAPLLLAEARNECGGKPIQVGKTWFAGDRVSLTMDHGTP